MTNAGLLLLCLVAFAHVDAGSWTKRSLARFQRARCNGDRETYWHGTGTLRNTVSGERIIGVEGVELARPLNQAKGPAYSSSKVLLYRHDNGTLLTSFSVGKGARGRKVRPLRYEHHVRMALEEGRLRLVASEPSGREVASVLADGLGPRRAGLLGHAYDLFLRVPASQQKPNPDQPRSARKKVPPINCREEYQLTERGPFGLGSTLVYRRTGRCPSWYGPGTCTLELHSRRRRQRSWAFWKQEPPAIWQACQDEADAACGS